MEARIIGLLLLLMTANSFGQDVALGERNGLIQTTGTLYPSLMLNHAFRNNYIGGHAVYYFEDKYSFCGDLLVYIDAQTDTKYIKKHIESTAGFGYHFGKKRWDPYLYAQFGLAAVQLQESDKTDMQPVAGMSFGVNYHIAPYFYFYAETVFRHMGDPLHPGNLDQLMVTGGLGFQLPTKRN